MRTMYWLKKSTSFLFIVSLLGMTTGCNSDAQEAKHSPQTKQKEKIFQHGEFISRHSTQSLFHIPETILQEREPYAWESSGTGQQRRITKEFFRCKGNNANPVRIMQEEKGPVRYTDCGGCTKHSLPLREGKEFVYPILLNLLNHIQKKTGMRVVITSGHRCPDHNSYVDPSIKNRYSKHQIAAEVAFYIQGMENRPDLLIPIIQSYYQEMAQYGNKKEYTEFLRYEKGDLDVTTPPWYNKEIFVKLYGNKEGRNLDVKHPYPYLSIQVRFDREKNERVVYSWDSAQKNYLRY